MIRDQVGFRCADLGGLQALLALVTSNSTRWFSSRFLEPAALDLGEVDQQVGAVACEMKPKPFPR